MVDTALVTGATAGLGAEFAEQLAAQGSALVLVARNAERLEEEAAALRARFRISVEVRAADLHDDDGVSRVLARLHDSSDPVSTLVNNAGYGLPHSFEENRLEDELNHAAIHLTVPLALSHAA